MKELDLSKPSHIAASFLVLFTLLIYVVIPTISFFVIPAAEPSPDPMPPLTPLYEFFLFATQLLIIALTFVLIPLIYYIVVDHYDAQAIFRHIKLPTDSTNILRGIAYGLLTVIPMFLAVGLLSVILQLLGVPVGEGGGNISTLDSLFSIPLLYALVIIQPIAEEFFIRGFLFDKFESHIGPYTAIVFTSLIFGLIHISYGQPITVIATALSALILGYSLYKTKNLVTTITAHIVYNVFSLTLYVVALNSGIA